MRPKSKVAPSVQEGPPAGDDENPNGNAETAPEGDRCLDSSTPVPGFSIMGAEGSLKGVSPVAAGPNFPRQLRRRKSTPPQNNDVAAPPAKRFAPRSVADMSITNQLPPPRPPAFVGVDPDELRARMNALVERVPPLITLDDDEEEILAAQDAPVQQQPQIDNSSRQFNGQRAAAREQTVTPSQKRRVTWAREVEEREEVKRAAEEAAALVAPPPAVMEEMVVQPPIDSIIMEEPVQFDAEPAQPVTEHIETVAEPTLSVGEPALPVAGAAQVVAEPPSPIAEPVQLIVEPAEPVVESTGPVDEPAGPVTEPAQDVVEPAQPVAVAEEAENVAEPALPVAEPPQPMAEIAPLVAALAQSIAELAQQPVPNLVLPVAEEAQPAAEPVAGSAQEAVPVPVLRKKQILAKAILVVLEDIRNVSALDRLMSFIDTIKDLESTVRLAQDINVAQRGKAELLTMEAELEERIRTQLRQEDQARMNALHARMMGAQLNDRKTIIDEMSAAVLQAEREMASVNDRPELQAIANQLARITETIDGARLALDNCQATGARRLSNFVRENNLELEEVLPERYIHEDDDIPQRIVPLERVEAPEREDAAEDEAPAAGPVAV